MKVKLTDAYRSQLFEMTDEWSAAGERIVPYAIRKVDYHDFERYKKLTGGVCSGWRSGA